MVGLLGMIESAMPHALCAAIGREAVGAGRCGSWVWPYWASTIASSTRRDSFFEFFGSVAP